MNENVPLVSNSRRAFANVEGECFSSLDAYSVTYRIWRETSKAVFASVFEDKLDRLTQALPRFFFGLSLAICTRNLGPVRDEPRAVFIYDRCKFVCHKSVLQLTQLTAGLKKTHAARASLIPADSVLTDN